MVKGVRITEQQDFAIAAIMARRGASAAVIGEAIAIEMPIGPSCAVRDRLVVIGSGPGAWLAFCAGAHSDWCVDLARQLSDLASISEQTGAYRLFQIEGPGARTLLQRGVALDLDASAFSAGSAAHSVIAHVDVVICCLSDGESYRVAVYRSYAESFLRWLDAAVAAL